MNHISELHLNDYVDGDLAAEARAAVELHCATCAECAQRLDRLTSLRLRLAELPRSIEPPPSIRHAVRARIDEPVRIAGITRLPRRQLAAAALVLHDIEGYTHKEIGDMTGIAAGTVKAQLHRARQLMQKWLEA